MLIARAYTSGNMMTWVQCITDRKGYDMLSLMDTVFGRVAITSRRGRFLDRLNAVLALHRSRTRLAALDAHLLDDIGLDRSAAQEEANRPVWDAPAAWKG
jgi:uncharacterized protein YjiS (DUF1127 family)